MKFSVGTPHALISGEPPDAHVVPALTGHFIVWWKQQNRESAVFQKRVECEKYAEKTGHEYRETAPLMPSGAAERNYSVAADKADSNSVRPWDQGTPIRASYHDILGDSKGRDVIDLHRPDRTDVEVALAIRFDAIRSLDRWGWIK